jgi:hypothetical protein
MSNAVVSIEASLADAAKKRDIAEIARVICRHTSSVGNGCHCHGDVTKCGAIIKHARAAAEVQAALVRTGRLRYE